MFLLLFACAHPPAEQTSAPRDPLPAPTVEVPSAFQASGPPSPRLPGTVPADAPAARSVSFLQTDKPLYRPGETVWVASRRVDAALAPPTSASLAHVGLALVDPGGGSVVEKRVQERAGLATNDLEIPATAAGGVWKVRVDLPDGSRPEREIVVVGHEVPRVQKTLEFLRKAYVPGDTVVATVGVRGPDGEPLVDRALDARIRVGGQDLPAQAVHTDGGGMALVRFVLPAEVDIDDSLLTVLVTDGGVTESIARRVPVDRDTLTVRLFPEGGTLVTGLPTRIYFSATRADGKPGDVSGVVVDDRGREVTPFASFHHGLGRFSLTPAEGRRYHLRLRGSARTVPVPAAEATGCVLGTPDDFASSLSVVRAEVRCTEPQVVALSASRRGRRLDATRVEVPAGRPARVHLDAGPRTAGAVRVTLYDADDVPVAERAVFRDRTEQLRVEVAARGTGFGPRDTVTLDVTTTDPTGRPVAADLSLVVVDEAALTWADDKQGDIVSAMLLESEVPGRVEEPSSYFAEPTGFALDLLLGTAGWRRFTGDASDVATAAPAAPPDPADAADRPVGRAPPVEARLGKADALLRRAGGDRAALAAVDRELAEQAGVLGALRAEGPVVLGDGGALAGLIGVRPAGLGGEGGLGQGFPDAGGRGGGYGTRVGGGGGVRTDTPVLLGVLDRGLVDAVVKRNLAAIRYCYQRALVKDPDLAGRLTVKFVIGADGSVTSSRVKVSTLGDPGVDACVLGRFQRMQFPAPKGGGVVIVSYPLWFEVDGADTPPVAPVRAFPPPPALGPARTDFRETIAWVPELHTDARGKASTRVTLSDALTRFRATVQGVGGGRVGRGDTHLVSTLPFSMRVQLPVAAVVGDHLQIPLTLTNTRDTAVTVRVDGSLGPRRVVEVPARGAETLRYDLAVSEPITVRFSADAAGLVDTFARPLRVVEAGFPQAWSASGRLTGTRTHTLTVDDPRGDGATAWIAAYPDLLPTLTEGLEGLLELPVGCFEQASSSNYPNLLVLQLLERGSPDAASVARSRALLDEGYRRLVGFESRGGGYEWFGGLPAHGALSAYGLLEFTQMKQVFEGVDDRMLARTRAWLLDRRDGEGGWRRDDRALDSFGRASPEVADAYILWALVQAGAAAELDTELDAAVADPPLHDAYRLALVTDALVGPRPEAAARLAATLAGLQDEDGAWRRADHSITRSGGRNLHVETTALAVRALLDAGGHEGAVEAGVRWLLGQRDGSGRWGSTQGTVLTLDVLARHAETVPPPGPGTAEVRVDGQVVGTLRWSPDAPAPRLALPVGNGTHTLSVVSDGSPVPYTIGARWNTRTPADTTQALTLTTHLADDTVSVGAPVRLTAIVTNPGDAGLAMVVAGVGIPAGLEPQTWQLRELVDTGVVDFYETRDAQVFLYWRSFGPGLSRAVPIDLLAVVPGTSTAPASSAWVYYDDDRRAWAAPVQVQVGAG